MLILICMKIVVYSILIFGLLAAIYNLFFLSDQQRISLCKISTERQFLITGIRSEIDKDICLSLDERKKKYSSFCASASKFSKNTFCKIISFD